MPKAAGRLPDHTGLLQEDIERMSTLKPPPDEELDTSLATSSFEAAVAMNQPATLQLLEETLEVSKKATVVGTVRVSTTTETFDDVAEVSLDRNIIDVSRVPVGRIVDVTPTVRTEGDTTIVPVIEERFIVVKQLYLKEELHIRHRVETEISRTPVSLKRQTAVVERVDAESRPVIDDLARKPEANKA